MSQQNPTMDRSVGVPGIHHGERFADMRARSKAFDDARVRAARRSKKPKDTITAEDFAVGDQIEVQFVHGNGLTIPGQALVIDVQVVTTHGYRWIHKEGRVYVRWITEGTEHFGHIFPLSFDRSYVWRGHVRWVSA